MSLDIRKMAEENFELLISKLKPDESFAHAVARAFISAPPEIFTYAIQEVFAVLFRGFLDDGLSEADAHCLCGEFVMSASGEFNRLSRSSIRNRMQ